MSHIILEKERDVMNQRFRKINFLSIMKKGLAWNWIDGEELRVCRKTHEWSYASQDKMVTAEMETRRKIWGPLHWASVVSNFKMNPAENWCDTDCAVLAMFITVHMPLFLQIEESTDNESHIYNSLQFYK
jgi:hypothetical protein